MYLISSNKIINGVLREGRKLDSEGRERGRDSEMGIASLLVADVLENREMSFFLHQSYEYTYVAITYEKKK